HRAVPLVSRLQSVVKFSLRLYARAIDLFSRQAASERGQFPPQPEQLGEAGNDAERGPRAERDQNHENQRRLPFGAQIIPHRDRVGILYGERKHQQEQREFHDPEQIAHCLSLPSSRNPRYAVPDSQQPIKNGMIFRSCRRNPSDASADRHYFLISTRSRSSFPPLK